MKTPKFWYQKNNIWQKCLQPTAVLYNRISRLYNTLKKQHSVQTPVICIGNIIVGGSGKTPLAIAIRELLKDFKDAFFLTRGYGGHLKGPLQVSPEKHSYAEVGDEALILAEHAPTFIARNRYNGAVAVEQNGAEVIIMDDGFQNSTLKKDLSFVVFNGEQGIGNGSLIPAGPLREPLEVGMHRADGVIFYGQDHHQLLPILCSFKKPIFKAYMSAITEDIDALVNLRVTAFSGIGYPEKFYNMLKSYGINLVCTKSFPDHYPYTSQDMIRLLLDAEKYKAQLVTTEKDYVRIPYGLREHVKIVRIRTELEKPEEMFNFIKSFV